MVDDIHFPKGLPSVPAAGQVQRVNRKKREDEKPPFEKFLDAQEQKDKKKRRRKKKTDSVEVSSQAEKHSTKNSTESKSADPAADAEDNSDQKIIDVRV